MKPAHLTAAASLLAPAAAAVLMFAASAPAQAQGAGPPPVANTDPARVQGGGFKIDPNHTRVLFSVSHLGFTTYYGEFLQPSGTATLDPKAPAADAIDVSVPTAAVSTSNPKLDGELKSAQWFDADRFPTIRFRSTRVTPTGAGQADVAGELTLHGVTRPVVLHATFQGSGANPLSKAYTVGFKVSGTIRRSDFGVKTYVPLVGDDVELIIAAALEKAS